MRQVATAIKTVKVWCSKGPSRGKDDGQARFTPCRSTDGCRTELLNLYTNNSHGEPCGTTITGSPSMSSRPATEDGLGTIQEVKEVKLMLK